MNFRTTKNNGMGDFNSGAPDLKSSTQTTSTRHETQDQHNFITRKVDEIEQRHFNRERKLGNMAGLLQGSHQCKTL